MLDRIDIKYFKLAVGTNNIGKETPDDIIARCPICGDSRYNKRMKRLHLYKKSTITQVNCFNGDCAVNNKTVYSFLRDFFPALLQQYKKETFTGTLTKLASGGSLDVFSNFKEEKREEKPVITQDLSVYMKDISESTEALQYLSKRGYFYNQEFGKWYFGTQDLSINNVLYKITNAIVIPLYYKTEMYGFYSRNINSKIFYTYMNDLNIGYKVWNWFNIDKSKPVYIFEGIFDAISGGLKNSIALMGAKLPEERLKELKYPIFVLDNDKTGLINSIEYAKQGYSVYIQPNIYPEKDMNKLKLNHNHLNISNMIIENIYKGISAEIRIKAKL